MTVEYRSGESALSPQSFIELARRIWPRDYDTGLTAAALAKTTNIGAWSGDRLVGSIRILSDGCFFSTIPEVMVDPEFRRQGIGGELLKRALDLAPGGTLFLGAQPGQERFFETAGFRRGPAGYVGRRAATASA
ncbi:MAG: GNAT family N-acetyltransferase [Vicinamibacterales bacterium]